MSPSPQKKPWTPSSRVEAFACDPPRGRRSSDRELGYARRQQPLRLVSSVGELRLMQRSCASQEWRWQSTNPGTIIVSCASITCAPAGLPAAVRALSDPAEAEDLRRFENQPAVEPTHLILLKGGTIIGMDPKVGDLVRGDLLIEGKRIAAIAPELAGACVGGTPRPSSRRLRSASLSREQMYASGCPSVL
jgi:hypothetical protein